MTYIYKWVYKTLIWVYETLFFVKIYFL